MDQLRLLMNATGTSGHSPKELIQRELVKGVLLAALGLAWAIVLVAMIALTAVLALEREFGAPEAAAITTGGLLLTGIVAALVLRGRPARGPASVPAPTTGGSAPGSPAPASLAENGDMLRVRNAWDVATLVALGVLAGFQRKQGG